MLEANGYYWCNASDSLGIWLAKTVPGDAAAGEGAGFSRSVMTELRTAACATS